MNKTICTCGNEIDYQDCCEPYITRMAFPPTPEALMRSRYTAYTRRDVDYLLDTMKGQALKSFDPDKMKNWAKNLDWLKLEIIDAPAVHPNGSEGFVEFIAYFKENGIEQKLHERSRFIREGSRWYYVEGEYPKNHTGRLAKKLGRNEPCSCGSGKKFKKCCGQAPVQEEK